MLSQQELALRTDSTFAVCVSPQRFVFATRPAFATRWRYVVQYTIDVPACGECIYAPRMWCNLRTNFTTDSGGKAHTIVDHNGQVQQSQSFHSGWARWGGMGICPTLGQPSWLGMGLPWSWVLSIDSDSHLYQSASEFNSMVPILLWYKWCECGISGISVV